MRKEEFKADEVWAHRSKRQLGAPAARVKLLALPTRKGHLKVKVRHLDGELEGMEEFVHATHLVCRWKDWKKVERDETKEATFLAYMADQPELDSVVIQATTAVLLSTGEDLLLDDYRNYSRTWGSQVPGLKRVAERAGVTDAPWERWPSFTNRNGDIYSPSITLVDLALAFAKVEPETVNLYLDLEEQTLLAEGYAFGERYQHDRLLKQKPAWVLARNWAEQGSGRDHLKDELERLHRLLHEAVRALEQAGDERTARRLLRGLEGK